MSEEIKTEKKGILPKNKEDLFELIVAIMLGVTAVLTAWATWVGSLHGGNQATNYAKSNNESALGNADWNEASQKMMQDMLLWNEIADLQLDIMYNQSTGDDEAVELAAYKLYYKCFDNLTDDMAAMIDFDFDTAADSEPVDYIIDWIDTAENALVSPFGNEDFVSAYYTEASEILADSEATLEQGQQDNKNGDHFNLVTVIYSIVLFLLGIVGVFKNFKNRVIVAGVAGVAFLVATIYMFTIPLPF